MANSAPEQPTNTRLLRTKRRLGLSGMLKQARAVEDGEGEDAPPASPPCVNCGYVQHGQIADRCPECGLVLAGSVREMAPWISCRDRWQGWSETCLGVWTWNRRLRINMSLLPTTGRSQAFAWRAGLIAAGLLACALVAVSPDEPAAGALGAARSLVIWSVGLAGAAAILRGMMWLLVLSLRGTWRRGLPFVPSSVHYSTAWWPPLAFLVLIAAAIGSESDVAVWTSGLVLVGLGTWGLWLWAGATECLRLRLIAVRILLVTSVSLGAAGALINYMPGPGQTVMAAALTQLKANISNLVLAGQSVVVTPKTYVLCVDNLGIRDWWAVYKRLNEWGMSPDTCTSLSGEECTIEAIEKAFEDLASKMTTRDRYVIYLTGHGEQYGDGAMQMAGRMLTSQKLATLVSKVNSGTGMLVIESCFGGKFIERLRGSCDAVVLTSTDDSNLGFRSGLTPFWKAFDDPTADHDSDGRIDVEEAYCHAFRAMVAQGEAQAFMARNSVRTPRSLIPVLDSAGKPTPQLDYLGNAKPIDFASPRPKVSASRPATSTAAGEPEG